MNIQSAIEDAGLTAHAPLIERLAAQSVRLVASRITSDETLPVGESRIGGTPDLPYGSEWAKRSDAATVRPSWGEQYENGTFHAPLPFLAQVNLSEVTALKTPDTPLPMEGFLFVWLDSDTGAWQLRYTNVATSELRSTSFPKALPPEQRYDAHRLVPRQETTLPYYGYHGTIGSGIGDNYNVPSFFDALDAEALPNLLTKNDAEDYNRFRRTLVLPFAEGTPEADRHRMLGYADVVQNPMILDAEVQTSDFPYDFGGLCLVDEPVTQSLIAQARESKWTLLLQIDSVTGANNMMWGDGGIHYWWIKYADLVQRDFSRVWYDFQMH